MGIICMGLYVGLYIYQGCACYGQKLHRTFVIDVALCSIHLLPAGIRHCMLHSQLFENGTHEVAIVSPKYSGDLVTSMVYNPILGLLLSVVGEYEVAFSSVVKNTLGYATLFFKKQVDPNGPTSKDSATAHQTHRD